MLIACIINLVIYAVVLVILAMIAKALLDWAGVGIPAIVIKLCQLLFVLIMLLYVLQCVGLFDLGAPVFIRPYHVR